jgi:hypothetical protein
MSLGDEVTFLRRAWWGRNVRPLQAPYPIAFLVTRTFTAAHRAPVLLVRLRSASVQSPRPRGAAEAIDTKSVWNEPTMTLLVGSALLDYLGPLGGRQSCNELHGCGRAGARSGPSQRRRISVSGTWARSWPLSVGGTSIPSPSLEPNSLPQLIVTPPPMGGRTRRRQ